MIKIQSHMEFSSQTAYFYGVPGQQERLIDEKKNISKKYRSYKTSPSARKAGYTLTYVTSCITTVYVCISYNVHKHEHTSLHLSDCVLPPTLVFVLPPPPTTTTILNNHYQLQPTKKSPFSPKKLSFLVSFKIKVVAPPKS